ncbi:hypothetical protein [Fonticella tunisiensis]|uniref:Uncharacterized protein n=1 Tax=Fonticella tunisiensis TaxID=1096341 RepID=A0A4V3EU43_9CLOT|nr:hypothetical protein [Fonticella tunisiensis]TDT60967.1 hypothetical protein EDD71_11085 [Fonticella tunisiensis]
MNRKLLGILLALAIFASSLAGFSKNIFRQYNESIQKTASAQKMNQSIDFELKMDSSGLNLPSDEQQILKLYGSSIKGSITSKYDADKKLGSFEGNVGLSEIIFNFKGFFKEDKLILQLPVLPKYLVIDIKELNKEKEGNALKVQNDFQRKLLNQWNSVVTKDKIKKTGDKKLSIGGENVDTTEFELNLTDGDVKKLITGLLDAMLKDEKFKKMIVESIKEENPQGNVSDADIQKEIDNTVSEFESVLKDVVIENAKYTGNIDKNSYLVQENYEFILSANVPDAGKLKESIKFTVKRWSIGKDVTVELPKLTKENSMSLQELIENSDSVLGDYQNQ